MISFNNRCSFPDLTSFGIHFLDAADQKTVWVNLIEEILLQYNLNDDKKRKQQFNCALKFIIHYQNSETATLSIRKITSLAKQLFHLYNSL
nr:hypothetical protein [Ignavibacteriaceae bacterium]